jgi:hypothetical protein
MSTKTERITILATPEFKARLEHEAQQHRISVSKLIRDRFERDDSDAGNSEQAVLAALIAEAQEATQHAHQALNQGLEDAEATLKALRQ